MADRLRLTEKEFAAVIVEKPNRGPDWSVRIAYAREVLIDGRRPVDVARTHGVTRQAVSRAANYFLRQANTRREKHAHSSRKQ